MCLAYKYMNRHNLYPRVMTQDLPNKKNLKGMLSYMDSNFPYLESLLFVQPICDEIIRMRD
jgi:hypothetical protein